nr:hypothetical protein [uncultured Sphingomonas sp.]
MKRLALILLAVLALAIISAVLAGSIVFAIGAAFYALNVLSWGALVGMLLAFAVGMMSAALIHRVVWPFARRQWE